MALRVCIGWGCPPDPPPVIERRIIGRVLEGCKELLSLLTDLRLVWCRVVSEKVR